MTSLALGTSAVVVEAVVVVYEVVVVAAVRTLPAPVSCTYVALSSTSTASTAPFFCFCCAADATSSSRSYWIGCVRVASTVSG